jgi:hypothetical protein
MLRKVVPIERKKLLGLLYLLTVLSMLFLLPTLFLTCLPSKLVDISLGIYTDFATIPAVFALGAFKKGIALRTTCVASSRDSIPAALLVYLC